MSATVELFDNPDVRDRYLRHYETVRGKVREQIVHRHLAQVVLKAASAPLRILDVGCGDGRDSVWLAELGHDVVGVDPADGMIESARSRLRTARGTRAAFHLGDASLALDRYGEGSFDLVLSHGVIMYQDDPAQFVAEHVRLLRQQGVLSLLAKNADALVYRAAREASVDEAIRLLDDSQGLGHLGVSTGGQTIQEIATMAFAVGTTVRSWAGVRMFSDTPTDILLEADDAKVIELEWRASLRDPYRKTAALLHVLLLNGIDESLLPDVQPG